MHVVGENSSYTVVYSVYTCACCTKSNRTYEEEIFERKMHDFLQLVKVVNHSIYIHTRYHEKLISYVKLDHTFHIRI